MSATQAEIDKAMAANRLRDIEQEARNQAARDILKPTPGDISAFPKGYVTASTGGGGGGGTSGGGIDLKAQQQEKERQIELERQQKVSDIVKSYSTQTALRGTAAIERAIAKRTAIQNINQQASMQRIQAGIISGYNVGQYDDPTKPGYVEIKGADVSRVYEKALRGQDITESEFNRLPPEVQKQFVTTQETSLETSRPDNRLPEQRIEPPTGIIESTAKLIFKEPPILTPLNSTGLFADEYTTLKYAVPKKETYYGQKLIDYKLYKPSLGAKNVFWTPFELAGEVIAKPISQYLEFQSEGLRRLAYNKPSNQVGEFIRKVIPKQEQFKEVITPERKISYPTKSTIITKGNYDPFKVIIPERKYIKPTRTETLIGGSQLASAIGIYSFLPMAIASPALIGEGVSIAKDTTKAPEQRLWGVVEAGGGLILGSRAAYKYARTPTIKYSEINPPQKILQKEVVGRTKYREVYIDEFGKRTSKDYFDIAGNQELITKGRRTIVSEKWKDWIGLKPTYEGLPLAQPGAKQYLFKSRFVNVYEKKGYGAAGNLLATRTKLTPSEIRMTLQFRRPASALMNYKGKGILVNTPKSNIVFHKIIQDYTRYPRTPETLKINNKFYPIRTRYAPTEKSIINIQKIPIKETLGKKGGLTFRASVKSLKLASISRDKGLSLRISEQGKLTQTYDVFGITKEFKKTPVGNIFITSGVSKRVIPAERYWQEIPASKALILEGEPSLIITTKSPIFVKDIITPTKLKFGKVKFTSQQAKDIIKTLRNIYGKPSKTDLIISAKSTSALKSVGSDFILPKTKELFRTESIKPITSKSQYWGAGLYERTPETSGILSIQSGVTSNIMAPSLISKARQLVVNFNLFDIKQKEEIKLGLEPRIKIIEKLKEEIKQRENLRQVNLLLPALKLKQQLGLKQRTTQRLRNILKIIESPVVVKTPIPPIRIYKFWGESSELSKTAKKLVDMDMGFDVVFGVKKQKLMNVNLPKEEAVAFGSKITRETLRASFGLVPSGKQAISRGSAFVDLSEFVPSKTRKGYLVEKAKFRLNLPQEKSEIQMWGKKKKKRGKSKWLF